jgi:hypothetical protein
VHIVPRELIACLVLLSMHVMYCALHVGFLFDDDDRLHGRTLPYTILDVVVSLFTTRCAMHS